MIIICLNPRCRFRLPTDAGSLIEICPKCGGPIQIMESPELGIQINHDSISSQKIALVLDNIRSAYNVGAIIRTADGAGVSQIHFIGITPTPNHPKVGKTALGSGAEIPWTQYWSYNDLFDRLDRTTNKVLCLEGGKKSVPLFDQKIKSERIILVVGNERQGIDPEIIQLSDAVVSLPMIGSKNSLNVSVACGIALYWLRFCMNNACDSDPI